MYPIHDTDAQLLLATLFASKRRPAELVDVVAAAQVLAYPISSASQWAEAFRRLTSHALIIEAAGGYTLSPAGEALCAGLPKKADADEQVFLVREQLSAYTPAQKVAALAISAELFEQAIGAHAALARQGGKNLLMPKPKLDDDELRRRGAGRRPFGTSRRRG